MLVPVVANAQYAPEEIVVTARKREETSISTPVVLSVVGAKDLERRAIAGVDGLTTIVPQLLISNGGGTIQGGMIVLRGIGTGESNTFADQAVAFDIDDVQVANASVRRFAEMDVQQIEVLKGPQALLFGKDSPGGIIAIHTADPTKSLVAKASLGYEAVGHEIRGDGYISGPITDSLGVRVAIYGSSLRGWVQNKTPSTALLAPQDKWLPNGTEYALRTTFKYEPNDRFDARLSMTHGWQSGSGPSANNQVVKCPFGTPQAGDNNDCTANNSISHGDTGPGFTRISPWLTNVPYVHANQSLVSLKMNYKLTDDWTLTSVTGLFDGTMKWLENFTATYTPNFDLPSSSKYRTTQETEELRIRSNYSGPINVMAGGTYASSRQKLESHSAFNALNPTFLNQYSLLQYGDAWSIFGQAMWNVLPTVELSGGARYSHEAKEIPVVIGNNPFVVQHPLETRATWNNVSPEVTATWRPTDKLTLFGSYKQGFLSGGFNAAITNFAGSLKYDQQIIKGFEVGAKAAALDNHLRLNLAAYDYEITGLQVSTTIVVNNVVTQPITNAGKVKIRGIEGDFAYSVPQLEALSFKGALAYNQARYDVFSVACWTGETPAQGCNFGAPSVSGAYSLQNLAGSQVLRAPAWSGSFGVTYETPIGNDLKLGMSTDATFNSSYFTDGSNNPYGKMPGYALLNASVRLAQEKDRWELAVIGNNLTDKMYWVRSGTVIFTGSGTGTVNGRPGDSAGLINRGRQIMLRVSVKTGE